MQSHVVLIAFARAAFDLPGEDLSVGVYAYLGADGAAVDRLAIAFEVYLQVRDRKFDFPQS